MRSESLPLPRARSTRGKGRRPEPAGIARAPAWALIALLTGCAGDPVPTGFAIVALLLSTAGGLAVGALVMRAHLGGRLYDAQREARAVPALAGAEPWRCDAAQRLTAGAIGPVGSAPWDGFDPGPGATRMREALTAQRALDPVPLQRDGQAWIVAATPLVDRDGGFDGHLGVARALTQDGPAQRAMAWLVDGAPGPAWVGARVGAGPWRVLAANGAARARLGAGGTLDDARLAAVLPAPLQAAWTAGEATAEGEGWRWQRAEVDGQTVATIWQPGTGAAGGDSATLSYTVSHDLRAPIRVVEGFTRILKEDYGGQLDRIANDHLDRVLSATARMNQMIDAMLQQARLSSLPLARQPVNLSQLAGWVVDDLRRAAPTRKAEVEIEPELHVHGDPTLLRLVLENLIGNAWKYCGKRSTARISLSRETIDGAPVFVVRDNGAGFDMRSADRLFGLFQRLHSASEFPGTGVGLASVRRIVQRHGGDIWATGEPDRGAAFHFTLRD